jgi:hypothetical protein
MIKNLVPAIVAGVFIVAGGLGGFFVKDMLSADATTKDSHASSEKDAHGKDDSGHGKDKGHGNDNGKSGSVAYFKFTREFVVPIIAGERVESLVILNLNLEVDAGVSQRLYEMEPKLRDNIMTTLVRLSSEGDTLGSLTEPDNYETLRSMILASLRTLVPEGIDNVLILDMAKQQI